MDVTQQLVEELPRLPKKLALAARYALEFPDQIALNSMRSSAQAVGVTSTTMLRLARELGFDSYEDFRSSFQTQLVSSGFGRRAGALHEAEVEGGASSLPDRILDASHKNLSTTFSDANLTNLSEIAALLRKAPNCLLVGSSVSYHLAGVMKSTGSMILPNLRLVAPEYANAAEDIGDLGKEDVVICFGLNPCAVRTVEALKYSAERGANTIAITDRTSSPLARYAKFVLYTETVGPHYYPSIIAAIALIETLLATVVAEGGAREQSRIKDFEKLRNLTAGYIEY